MASAPAWAFAALAGFSARTEEGAELACGLVGKDAGRDLKLVVEPRVMADVVEGAQGAALGVCGAKDAAVYAGVDHEAGAHEAGLQRDIDGAAGEPPAAKDARGLHHCAELRVGRGVKVQLAAVVARATTWPSQTTTAPMGTSPSAAAASASASARRMYFSSSDMCWAPRGLLGFKRASMGYDSTAQSTEEVARC